MSVTTERPTRRPDVWLRTAEGENVVFDPATGAVHILNATALAIWELCDGETRTEEMVEAICGLSGLPRDVVQEDVERILVEFEQANIVIRGE
jgi:PqqD family protein of HPr-rel-A system